jgi:diguanylate cyclase (GGDEF)-like protein
MLPVALTTFSCDIHSANRGSKMNKDFQTVVRNTLHFLHQRYGFALWMFTRIEENDWIVLTADDHGYGIGEGTVFPWKDSLCSRMVDGLGPHVAPAIADVASYASAPIAERLKIGAYVGIPLRRRDGSLFGTLCAIDPLPQPTLIAEEQELIELIADLLNRLLNAELTAAEAVRRAERAEVVMMRDPLTALYNRRGWDRLLAKEEERCRRYGHPACIISIDLDELKLVNDTAGHAAGDTLLQAASRVIEDTVRTTDIAARLGGDEFGILAVECDAPAAAALLARLRARMQAEGIKASCGLAMRQPEKDLQRTFSDADAAMYADKKRRKASETS